MLNEAVATDQHKQVEENPWLIEELSFSAVFHEALCGIIAAIVILLLVFGASLAVFCSKYMAGLLLKSALRSGIYNESVEPTNRKAIRADLVLNQTDHGKWLTSYDRARASKFPKGARKSSRTSNIEFIQPNNSLLSGKTVTNVVLPNPTASIIYSS